MATCTITITDTDDGPTISAEFDPKCPGGKHSSARTDAQNLALHILHAIHEGGGSDLEMR